MLSEVLTKHPAVVYTSRMHYEMMPDNAADDGTSDTPAENLPQSLGGKRRAEKLTAYQRKEIALKAAEARWGGQLPFATHDGVLHIGTAELACAVLNTRKRVLAQETIMRSIGRTGKPNTATSPIVAASSYGLPPFLAADNLKDFITDELREATTPIMYRTKSRQRAFGYEAQILPLTCEVYLSARDARATTKQQAHIVKACDMLMRGLARVGIIALIDEVTGYQEERARDELFKILEAYIAPELMPWTRRFPDEFIKQMYRLHGWEYREGNTRGPRYAGKFINKYVYGGLPPQAVEELKQRSPVNEKGQRPTKLYKFLTADTGVPHLDWQISTVTTLMRAAADKPQFEELYGRAFDKEVQPALPFGIPARKLLPAPAQTNSEDNACADST